VDHVSSLLAQRGAEGERRENKRRYEGNNGSEELSNERTLADSFSSIVSASRSGLCLIRITAKVVTAGWSEAIRHESWLRFNSLVKHSFIRVLRLSKYEVSSVTKLDTYQCQISRVSIANRYRSMQRADNIGIDIDESR